MTTAELTVSRTARPLARVGRQATLLLGLAATACGPKQFPDLPAPPAGDPSAETVVYLIGDAGKAARETPVLVNLKREVAERSRDADVAVAFLGDNVYEHGLHELSHPDHAIEVEYLEAQIEVVRGSSAKGLFVPGNHDWGYGDERGLAQIRRQEAYVAEAAGAEVDVAFLPAAGCPGPELVPVGESVMLLLLETDLWLRDPESSWAEECRNASTEEALRSLKGALRENAAGANRHVVVLAHHPLKTYGPHGGYFGLKDWLFPGTILWAPLYIPLPILYPAVRSLGVSSQDIKNKTNRRMREQLGAAFSEVSGQPLVYAAGHEHSLQVFEGHEFGVEYALVSGAGSKLTNVGNRDALFAVGKQQRERGYMRLEFYRDGRVLLSVVTDGTASCEDPDSCRGEPTIRYWRWLSGEGG
jgi:hypothetical protein